MIRELPRIIVDHDVKSKTVNAITLLRLKRCQTEFRSAPNQSGKCNYNQKPGTHRETFQKPHQIQPNSDCIHHPPTDLEPNRHPFGSKPIGKW